MAVSTPLTRTTQQPMLGVKRKVWRRDDEHAIHADEQFKDVRSSVLQRDAYTCVFCNFKSAKFQEIHHLDDDHTNNTESNLVTVCTLCHQVHHLGMCGVRNGGFLAAIPELTQTEVNQVARAVFVAEVSALGASQEARERLRSLYAIFEVRGADTLKHLFGLDISAPLTFAQLLSDPVAFPDELYARRGDLLGPLRLVPTREAFHAGQLDYYALNNRSTFLPEHWHALTRQLMS